FGCRHGLGKIEDGRLELRVCGAERERIGAASAACVEKALAASERYPLRHQARRAERTRMLGRAEGLAAKPRRIDHALVKALVGKNPLPAKRRGQMPET